MAFSLICLYRKPSAKLEFYDQLKNLLHSLDFNKEVILMGDFNINWSDKGGRKKLKNITDYFNLTQLIEQPTRITNRSETKIDVLFKNRPERIIKTYNLVTGLSDHNSILFSRKLQKHRFHSSATPICKYESVPTSQQENLGVALREIEWNGVLSKGDLESDCDRFTSTIKKVMGPYLRKWSQNKSRDTLPRLNEECRKLMKERDQLLKQSLKTGLTTDRQKFISLRNKVIKRLRQAKANFFIDTIEEARGNGKKIWQTINKLIGRKQNYNNTYLELKINTELVTNPIIISTELNTFFLDSVYEITQSFNSPSYYICSINYAQLIFQLQEISEIEVANTISGLKNSKAMDIYGLDTNFLKRHKETLLQPIAYLINQSLRQSIVPSAWKMALVTPIFKSGERSDMANYRPISILPVVSKIVEKWVAKLLIQHLNKSNNSFHPMQFGFRAHHSTETANCLFLEKVKGYLDKSSYVGAVYLDLKQAFDTVNHKVLLSKLTYFNFSEQALNWIKS